MGNQSISDLRKITRVNILCGVAVSICVLISSIALMIDKDYAFAIAFFVFFLIIFFGPIIFAYISTKVWWSKNKDTIEKLYQQALQEDF
ncbi:hypothetical protein KSZ_13110 [Dictyobacter formicarum]|uniref:Uncharacterized protein n=1 Tax=Dictyobacter formicarum TaxID=2778368 RepID=A0ABQ3VBG5_9CHLR|nr:hypothetical protein KSZ_13110 [Dictyobacter formicarum]